MKEVGDDVETFFEGRVTLWSGDCLSVLSCLPDCSVDSCVTDPPYHLTSIVKRFGAENAAPVKAYETAPYGGNFPHQASGGGTGAAFARMSKGFMGKQWDGGDIAFRPEVWAQVFRVLKPGGYLLAFGGTRTYHRMACAIEDAGFDVRDMVSWVYGSGFPKSHNVGDGWGTALKPALEPICMARKPLIGTVAANVLAHGTGALNIDGCRVETDAPRPGRSNERSASGLSGHGGAVTYGKYAVRGGVAVEDTMQGRWPANVIHDGSEEVTAAFPEQSSGGTPPSRPRDRTRNTYGAFGGEESPDGIGSSSGNAARFFYQVKPDNGREGEASAERRYTDEGATDFAALPGMRRDAVPPSRLFYSAKADADDRIGSKHPTVKPVDLMQYLVRLVTPKGGTILDPFSGTGTTGEAAWREGMRAVLIEREAEYQADIRRRMALCLAGPDERAREAAKALQRDRPVDAGPLFLQIRPPVAPSAQNEPAGSPPNLEDIPDFLLRKPYDGHADFAASYSHCLAAVRERVANGGEPWVPKK